MSSADWDEVKRLAADFQRAQLTTAAQRLTERNCVEIVNKLIELKLLDVVFTSDGKEYVTPQQLGKEIMDELYVHQGILLMDSLKQGCFDYKTEKLAPLLTVCCSQSNLALKYAGRLIPCLSLGRLTLVDLATTLNVSLGVITARATELVKIEKGLHLVLGQLITTDFLDSFAQDVNEVLRQDGVISLHELSKTSDLPGDFLMEQMIRRVGKIIKGKQDETENWMIYTETFVQRNTAKLRGILSGIMRPTPINQIMHKVNDLSEKLFFGILKKLLSTKRVDGVLSGSSRTSYYIPTIYTRAQTNYIDRFMNGNGYVDLEAAARLGITDPKSFVEKRFPAQKLVFLNTSCLGEQLFQQVKDSVEESLLNPGWVDVGSLLPFGINEKEVNLLLQQIPRTPNSITLGSCIVSMSIVDSLKERFRPLMADQSVKDVESGKYAQVTSQARAAEKKAKTAALNAAEADSRSHKKEDRRKKAAAGGGKGGGTQGRESKTKSTKKKYLVGRKEESESEDETTNTSHHDKNSKTSPPVLTFLSPKEIIRKIEKDEALADAPSEILSGVAAKIHPVLQAEYQVVAKAAYDAFVSDQVGTKSKDALLVKVKRLISFMKLYGKGLECFEEDEIKGQLEKYLLRNFGQELINALVEFFLVEAGIQGGNIGDLEDSVLTGEILHLSKSSTASDFLDGVEKIFQVRRTEKDLESVLVEARESLEAQLESAEETKDPALFLHVFVLLMFSFITKSLLSASGKFVPHIVSRSSIFKGLKEEDLSKIRKAQEAVMQHIKSKGAEGQVDTIYGELKALLKSYSHIK